MKGQKCICFFLYSYRQLFDRMCMTLGGRAAEAITFRKITTGDQNPFFSPRSPSLCLPLPPSLSTLLIKLAQHFILNTPSSGAQDDLDKVTQTAYRQVVEYSMSPTIGHISLPHKRPSEPARRMYSDKLARMIDEVMDILYSASEKCSREKTL